MEEIKYWFIVKSKDELLESGWHEDQKEEPGFNSEMMTYCNKKLLVTGKCYIDNLGLITVEGKGWSWVPSMMKEMSKELEVDILSKRLLGGTLK